MRVEIECDFDIARLDGAEIAPGVTVIGEPTWHEKEWRALANVYGMLAVVAFQVRVVGKESR